MATVQRIEQKNLSETSNSLNTSLHTNFKSLFEIEFFQFTSFTLSVRLFTLIHNWCHTISHFEIKFLICRRVQKWIKFLSATEPQTFRSYSSDRRGNITLNERIQVMLWLKKLCMLRTLFGSFNVLATFFSLKNNVTNHSLCCESDKENEDVEYIVGFST